MSLELFKKIVDSLKQQGIKVVPAQWFHDIKSCFRGPNGIWFVKIKVNQ